MPSSSKVHRQGMPLHRYRREDRKAGALHGREYDREARNEESDGGKGGEVTDKIGHLSLLTCYVPILFSFCFGVNSFFGLARFQRGATRCGSSDGPKQIGPKQ